MDRGYLAFGYLAFCEKMDWDFFDMDCRNYERDWDYAGVLAGVLSGVLAYLTVEFEPLMPVWGAVWYPRYLVSLFVSLPHFEMHFELFPLFLLLLVSFAFEHL